MEHKAWKWFFIRRFLLILALVSLSEWLLNLFYHNCLYPWLEEVFHIRFFMAGWEDGQSISLLFKGVLYLAARGISSQFPGVSGDWLQWAAEQAASFQAWLRTQPGKESEVIDGRWPVRR